MNNPQIDKEFRKIAHEIIENKPKSAPYPQNIVRKRELLLVAEALLGNILSAKEKQDKPRELFETEIYRRTMEFYYNWCANN